MRLQKLCSESSGPWGVVSQSGVVQQPQLALLFGPRKLLEQPKPWQDLHELWPSAQIVACATSGPICGTEVMDNRLVATAIELERASLICVQADVIENDSRKTGGLLASQLPPQGLRHVLIFSDGIHVNGSQLIRGCIDVLPPGVQITGGLSGDGDHFHQSYVGLHAPSDVPKALAIGLYGPALRIGFGCVGGWDPFGPRRVVTRSQGNVLYTLDGRPALPLYKRYLAGDAAGLPATGLYYPLEIHLSDNEPVVRTILSINETDDSITFAGDLEQGCAARLMRANLDRLVTAAASAAQGSQLGLEGHPADLALLISCHGRKLVLNQRVEEELEGARSILGSTAIMTGFYSYGEISPFHPSTPCEFHNQTMTITTLAE